MISLEIIIGLILVLQTITIIILLMNLRVFGSALSMIDCMHDKIHTAAAIVIDDELEVTNYPPPETSDTLFEDL